MDSPKKDDPNFQYASLSEAVDKIYFHITTNEYPNFARHANSLDLIEYFDGTSWQPLSNILVW